MKIIIKTYQDDYDFIMHHRLIINGEDKAFIGRCEPEDAIIGRDLIDAHDIVERMKEAYKAGVNGEELKISVIECNSKEFEE